VVIGVCLIVGGWLAAYPIELIRLVVNAAVHPSSSGPSLWLLAAEYYAVVVAASLVSFLSGWLMSIAEVRLACSVREDVYGAVMVARPNSLVGMGTGGVMTRVLHDATSIAEISLPLFGFVASVGAKVAFGAYYLLKMDWRLGVAAVPLAAICGLLASIIGRKATRVGNKLVGLRAQLWRKVQEDTVGLREIQACGREETEQRRLSALHSRIRSQTARQGWLDSGMHLITGTAFPLATIVIIVLGGRYVQSGRIAAGELTAFLLYIGMFSGPMIRATELIVEACRRLPSVRRAFEVVDAYSKRPVNVGREPIPDPPYHLHLEDLEFVYPQGRAAIRDVSLWISAGQHIGIVGPRGAGKTTLMLLLMRFLDPTRGRIRLNGTDIRRFDLQDYRALFGIVFQDPYIFSGSVSENIRFGRPSATDEEVRSALLLAGGETFVRELSPLADFTIEESGANLSRGQKQCIAIARALLRRPRVLILDEATASFDGFDENRVYESISRVGHEVTCLTVAHRLSAVCDTDAILVLADGEIVESGPPGELVARGGRYASIFNVQLDKLLAQKQSVVPDYRD
jgi:ABC-type multidrug transport system fused ATPase/permease subunit